MNVNEIRKDFPLLKKSDLIYLDNAATAQKPACVLAAEREFYENCNANPLRGLYELSEAATQRYEEARRTLQRFIHAESPEEIIFTRNATEGLNLIAYSWGAAELKAGDEILVSIMEHHSNLLPWQQAARRTGAALRFLECTKDGELTPQMVKEALTERTKLLAITQVSNVLGWENELAKIAKLCHENGTVIVADGAQSVAHFAVDVQEMDVDFFAFSGHKMLGPMGIGVLYGKKELLEKMPPFLTGGEMIESVSRTGAVFAALPHKFEAGTVNAAGAVALAEAARYLEGIGFEKIQERENALTALAMEELEKIPEIHVLGVKEARKHYGILSFTVDGVHPHDVASILDADKIAVRAGHHCAQPLLQYLGRPSVTRASLAFYNTEEEILRFAESIKQIRRKMGYGA
ncbi:MAG: SufS family cysteine desulfurase [Eubacteriales bacterium]|nr:SufS family cysteine desulfurase [Eubacteriales bacterium]